MDIVDSIEDIQNELLAWFLNNGRHWIPWKLNKYGQIPKSREIISPYGIWIAEIMLQQTQLKVVIPYWEKWMRSFPTLKLLEEADLQTVLLNWQGLGYYSRAKRIHTSSQLLVKLINTNSTRNDSLWPVQIDQWMSLPGIGRSTAGSIISSAFDLPSPILDGNVKRIFSRLIASDKSSRKDDKRLWRLSNSLLSVESPRNFNQALMDLGATVCTKHKPRCYCCPLKNYCLAFIKYDPVDFPKKEMKKIISSQQIGIGLVFNKEGELLIDQRNENSSMGGMWEFPGGKKESDESIEDTIKREITEELGININVGEKLISFEHLYSHKKLHFTVHICEWKSGNPKALASQRFLWIAPDQLSNFPFPAANSRIIAALNKHLGFDK